MTKNNIIALKVWFLFVMALGIIVKLTFVFYGQEFAVYTILAIWVGILVLLLILFILFILNLFLGTKKNTKLNHFFSKIENWMEILSFRK